MSTQEPTNISRITIDEIRRESESVDLATQLFGLQLTRAQAAQRRSTRKKKSSKYKGVYPSRGKWRARITCQGRGISLGNFSNEGEAARAYDRAARKIYGNLADTNFSEKR